MTGKAEREMVGDDCPPSTMMGTRLVLVPPPLVQRRAKAQKMAVRPGGGVWTRRCLDKRGGGGV